MVVKMSAPISPALFTHNSCSEFAALGCQSPSGPIGQRRTHSARHVGGEVDALDPGAYGSFTISHAITIEGQVGQ
jgi:hypothetical protein